MRARDWTLRLDNAPSGSLVSEIHPSSVKGGGFFFNLPNDVDSPGWSADYLTVPCTAQITAGFTIRFAFKIEAVSGSPVFQDPDGQWPGHGLPPGVRPVLIHKNGNDRWWSLPSVLATGAGVITANLKDELAWWNQNGIRADLVAGMGSFADTLENIGSIGVTYGAGDDSGHGTFTTGGKARFTMSEVKLA